MAKKNRRQRQAARAGAAGTASPSSPEEGRPRQPTQAERFEARRRVRSRRELRTRILIGSVVVLAVGGLVFNWANSRRQSQRLISSLEAGSCDFDRDTDAGRDHVVGPAYRVDPPAGGDHLVNPAPAGVYEASTVPPDGNLVHSLEHGFVILWHLPDLPSGELDQVLDVAAQYERDVLVVPRASLSTPVAASAWHKRLLCSSVEPEVLSSFVDEFRNDGPEDVPH